MRGRGGVFGSVREGRGDSESGDLRAASPGWERRGSEVEGSRGAGGSVEVFGGPGTTFSFLGRDWGGGGGGGAAGCAPPLGWADCHWDRGRTGAAVRRAPGAARGKKGWALECAPCRPSPGSADPTPGPGPGALSGPAGAPLPLPLPVWPQQEADGWDRAGGGGRRSHGIRAARGPPSPRAWQAAPPPPNWGGERGRSHLSSSPLPWRPPPPLLPWPLLR